MNTRRMAMDYIRRGQSCLKESKDVFEEGDYPMAIRKAQECVELSLKAALRAISVEYPREHDVGRALELVKGRVPDWFSLQISEFMKISRDLAKKRGPAFYGFETELKPASDIFTRGGC